MESSWRYAGRGGYPQALPKLNKKCDPKRGLKDRKLTALQIECSGPLSGRRTKSLGYMLTNVRNAGQCHRLQPFLNLCYSTFWGAVAKPKHWIWPNQGHDSVRRYRIMYKLCFQDTKHILKKYFWKSWKKSRIFFESSGRPPAGQIFALRPAAGRWTKFKKTQNWKIKDGNQKSATDICWQILFPSFECQQFV